MYIAFNLLASQFISYFFIKIYFFQKKKKKETLYLCCLTDYSRIFKATIKLKKKIFVGHPWDVTISEYLLFHWLWTFISRIDSMTEIFIRRILCFLRKHAVYLYAGTDIRETSTKSVNENPRRASSSIKRLVEARDVTWWSKNIVRDP